jgi:hypothetical protein
VKTHIASIAYAILGTVLGGLILAWLLSPPSGQISAQAVAIEIPLDKSRLNFAALDQLKLPLDELSGVPGLSKMVADLRFTSSVELVELAISNDGSVRSKPVEVRVNGTQAYAIQTQDTGGSHFGELVVASGGSISLGQLNPGASANILLISDQPLPFRLSPSGINSPIQVLEGGRAVNVLDERASIGVIGLIMRYAPFSELVVILAFAIAILFVMFVLSTVFIQMSPERQFKFTSSKELKRTARFLAYVVRNHPDALTSHTAPPPSSHIGRFSAPRN